MFMVKHIIFDLDGTIADTLEQTGQALNRVLKNRGMKLINQFEVEEFRKLDTKLIVKRLGVSRRQMAGFVLELKSEMKKRESTNIFPEAIRVLDVLKDDFVLSLVTSSPQDLVNQVIESNELYFDSVYSDVSIFGKSRVLKKILKNSDYSTSELMYVGDETRDIDAAKTAGIQVGVVSWGYNHIDKLASMHPDYVFRDFRDILRIND